MTENCNDCKHEKECNHTGKYDYTYDKIMDYQTNKEYNSFKDICDLLNEQEKTIKHLTDELFEARKDYIIDTADISDKPYLDEMIEEERKEIYGDVE